MEKQPQFLKKFSKEQSADARTATARSIRAKRTEHFSRKQEQTDERAVRERSRMEQEREAAERQERIEQKLHDIGQLERYNTQPAVETPGLPHALENASRMLAEFYNSQKKQWAQSDYTQEDIVSHFSEEHLASLSLDDYALLLQRYPGQMVAHVTRQGIRDHIGHIYHTGGADGYADGFMRMLGDGRLRSPLGVHLVEEDKHTAIATFLRLDQFGSKEEARVMLDRFLDPTRGSGSGSYVDRQAIHFATEDVADVYYGSEKGNEIFLAYPSAHVASQYYFNANLATGGGGYWNDQWVWANEERGMNLDAGVVFIPKNARVDARTGSRYELGADMKPVENTEFITIAHAFLNDEGFDSFAREAIDILKTIKQDWSDRVLSPQNRAMRDALEPFRLRIERDFNVADPRLQRTLLDYNFLKTALLGRDIQKKSGREPNFQYRSDNDIKESLGKRGILFRETSDAIPSEEFWEGYFNQHPDQRPSKIVYYEGSDPSVALKQWKERSDIKKKATDSALGFEEQSVQRTSEQATAGMDRFRTLAEQVIEGYFAKISP